MFLSLSAKADALPAAEAQAHGLASSAPPPAVTPPPGSPVFRTFAEPVVESRCTRPLVLLYHGFDRGNSDMRTPSRTLEGQLAWLQENRIETISMQEFLAWYDGTLKLPSRVAVLTVDDGEDTLYTRAWPVLKKYNARFVVGLPTANMERHPYGVVTWPQLAEMQASGLCEVVSHGHRHVALTALPRATAAEELGKSLSILAQHDVRTAGAFFYPLGAVDPLSEQKVADAGFRGAFTAAGAPIAFGVTRRYHIPRVSMHRGTSRVSLEMFWGRRFWSVYAKNLKGCDAR